MTCKPDNYTPDQNGDGKHCAHCGRIEEYHVEEKWFDWDPGIKDHSFEQKEDE